MCSYRASSATSVTSYHSDLDTASDNIISAQSQSFLTSEPTEPATTSQLDIESSSSSAADKDADMPPR